MLDSCSPMRDGARRSKRPAISNFASPTTRGRNGTIGCSKKSAGPADIARACSPRVPFPRVERCPRPLGEGSSARRADGDVQTARGGWVISHIGDIVDVQLRRDLRPLPGKPVGDHAVEERISEQQNRVRIIALRAADREAAARDTQPLEIAKRERRRRLGFSARADARAPSPRGDVAGGINPPGKTP